VPDLQNFRRIVDWLELPAESFLESTGESSTPEVIARHLRADRRLTKDAASKIAELVEDMYQKLMTEQNPIAAHLRSAKLFTPAAGTLLAEILSDMESNLRASPSD